MDAIGNISFLPKQAYQPAVGTSGGSAPVLPKPASADEVLPKEPQQEAPTLEQRRFEAVKKAAQEIANRYVLGERRFTIFKDTTGQYITRYTNLRDGRVTYIPEPELLRASERPSVSLDV